MKVIENRNVNGMLTEGYKYLKDEGKRVQTRAGAVLVAPGPVTSVYQKPTERVLFNKERDANPFFHLMESLWMIAGRNDVSFPTKFVKSMKDFSDNGDTFHGAYGYRWFKHFCKDQIFEIIKNLKDNPSCRRQVLGMWDVGPDLGRDGKDLPCNTHAYFSIDDNGLNMTVCNRSNDMVWGAYGANAVHFSFLQEYMAGMIGVDVGIYYQMSNNFHAYDNTFEKFSTVPENRDLYIDNTINPFPIFTGIDQDARFLLQVEIIEFIKEVEYVEFIKEVEFDHRSFYGGYESPFVNEVIIPIYLAHNSFKTGKEMRYSDAKKHLKNCKAMDWKIACSEWIARREEKYLKAKDDGVSYE